MDRKPIDPRPRAGGRPVRDNDTSDVAEARRIDRLAEVVDRCTEAREIADSLDEKLLAYLLAMAIQETRAAMRQEVAAAAGPVRVAPRPAGRPKRAPAAG